jgi:hypothetical protein
VTDVNLSGAVFLDCRLDGMTMDGFDIAALMDAERRRLMGMGDRQADA